MPGRRAGVLGAICVLLLAGCGGADATPGALGAPTSDAGPATTSLPAPPTPEPTRTVAPSDISAADLRGLWGAGDGDGAQIVYEFDGDGTFTRVSLLREERESGTFRFQDVVEGRFKVEDGTLSLRPSAGTQTVDDPRAGDGPVSTRKTDLDRESHSVEIREDGTVLVLTPRKGAAVTLVRQQG